MFDAKDMEDFLDFIMEAMNSSEEEFCKAFPDPFLLVEFEGSHSVGELDTTVGYHRKGMADTVAGIPTGVERIKDDKICTIKGSSGGSSANIGRSPGNDIILDYPRVSKKHATIAKDPSGEFKISDAGSTNGTVVNSKRLAKGEAVLLKTGDRIEFGGDFVAVFYTPSGLFSYITRLAEDMEDRKKRGKR